MLSSTLDALRSLAATDGKSLSEKALKTAEETGELAKVVLPFCGAATTTHRFVDRQRVLEEVADVILCVRSIACNLDFSDEEVEDMVLHKMRKWAHLQAKEEAARYPLPYEFHITVRTTDIPGFRTTCAALGVKPIVLDLQDRKGASVMEDVMTSSTLMGDNPDAYREMERIAGGLLEAGFDVVRKKIETVPWHPAAPQTAYYPGGIPPMPKNCYFEAHLGVVCNEGRRDELREIAEALSLHLSRNIFKKLEGDSFKIMLTARNRTGCAEDFQERIDVAAERIRGAGFDVDKVIVEFSVYDTRVSHDAAWVKEPTLCSSCRRPLISASALRRDAGNQMCWKPGDVNCVIHSIADGV